MDSSEQLDSSASVIFNESHIGPRIGEMPLRIGESYNEDTGLANPAFEEEQQQCNGPSYHLVLDFDIVAWNVNEKRSFLFCLYTFGKNFVPLKRFVESKRMVDILDFYYGTFHGSIEYFRWIECCKTKSKRFAYGRKLFVGKRLQELLSRLFLSVSAECKQALCDVSEMFKRRKMKLQDYVFSLKAIVGTDLLVHAVAIGKENKDLTRTDDDELTPEMNEERDGMSTSQLNRYLQPRTKSRITCAMKLGVVDMSLTDGNVRELRTLSLEVSNKATSSSHTEVSEESSDKADDVTTKFIDRIVPFPKRRRTLRARSHPEPEANNLSIVPVSEPEMPCPGRRKYANDGLSPPALSQGNLLSTTSSQGFQAGSIECASDSHTAEDRDENCQGRILIDLNLPLVPPDFESGVLMTESAEEENDHSPQKPEDHDDVEIFPDVATPGQQCQVIKPRRSTRNWPPTAKTLEAVANGLLKVNRKPRKNKEISSREN